MDLKEPEITGIEIGVSMKVLNTKGLSRKAGLTMDLTMDLYNELSTNKGKWNKHIGDMVKHAVDACIARIKEEYVGIAGLRDKPDEVTEAWAEQNARAAKIAEANKQPITLGSKEGHDVIKQYLEKEAGNDGS